MMRPKWKVTLLPATKRWHKTMDTCRGTLSLGQMDFWTCFKKLGNTSVFWHNWQSLNHLWFITLLNVMWPVVLKVWPPTNCISTPGNLSGMQMFESHLKQKLWGGTQQSVLTHSPHESLRTAVLYALLKCLQWNSKFIYSRRNLLRLMQLTFWSILKSHIHSTRKNPFNSKSRI